MLGSLEIVVTDLREFVMFLKGCPALYRQLYSTYLVLGKCMFVERINKFLMQNDSPGAANLDVLPIVGPAKAGKSTLFPEFCYLQKTTLMEGLLL